MAKKKNICVRVDQSDYVKIKNTADFNGLSVAEYVRSLCGTSGRKQKRTKAPAFDLKELVYLRELTGELSGALVQSAIKIRIFTGKQNQDIEILIPEIKALALAMNKILGRI
ncbi:MAG: hypothetical protein POG74_09315 [Acidocella sp.]|nr:hypothetical protein [Acidocella sp.]